MQYMLKRAFDLHRVACQTSAENEPKAEFLSEEQSYETIVTKHPNFERQTKEMNPTNETKEHEKVPASHTGEKLEIIDDRNFIQEGENEMEKQLKGSYLKLQLKVCFQNSPTSYYFLVNFYLALETIKPTIRFLN